MFRKFVSLSWKFGSISFVIIGGFNIDFCNRSHFLYSYFCTILHSFSLTQVVDGHTHVSPSGSVSCIDLALVSNLSQLKKCEIIPPLTDYDHGHSGLQVYNYELEGCKKMCYQWKWKVSHLQEICPGWLRKSLLSHWCHWLGFSTYWWCEWVLGQLGGKVHGDYRIMYPKEVSSKKEKPTMIWIEL